jgi:hypothetical protein
MKNLGVTTDGHRIIARACGEDNSGIVCDTPDGFELRLYEDDSGEVQPFLIRDAATRALKDACSSSGMLD